MGVQIYVAPNGNDGNPGTQQQPYGTLYEAQKTVRKLVAIAEPTIMRWYGPLIFKKSRSSAAAG